MLYFMVSSAHYPHGGYFFAEEISMTAFLLGIGLILVIEANAIWGKMFSAIASVREVIISGFVLTILISGIAYYL